MNKFVRTKSHTGSKFSKTYLGLLCARLIVVVHLFMRFFSAASDGATAERQIPDRIFWSIFTSFRRIASPIMHGFGRYFRHLLEDWMCFTTH